MTSDQQISSYQAARKGIREVCAAPGGVKAVLVLCFLVGLLMLPLGRTAPNDGGGLLAPLTVDSGFLFRTKPAADFFSVYDAGSRVLAFRDPYGVNQDTGGPGLRAPYVATFRYLPITAFWLAVPLNIFPPWAAYSVWVAVSFLFLVFNFLLCVGRRPDRLLLLGGIWFVWFPLIAEFHMGQFSLFMATLLLWGIDGILCERGRGLGWAFAVLLKVYPIAMAPSLFLWGWRRLVVVTAVIAIGSTLAWKFAVPSDIQEGLMERGIAGRIVNRQRTPYAGAMGVQEMVNAVFWKGAGRSFSPESPPELPDSQWKDPVFVLNLSLLAGFAGLCLWALIKTRGTVSLPAIGLFWMSWFFAYVDVWEHHYVFIQALIGLLIAWRIVDWKVGLMVWISAGGPSLWWLWYRLGYAGTPASEMVGFLYFIQRPFALFLLAAVLTRRLGDSSKTSISTDM